MFSVDWSSSNATLRSATLKIALLLLLLLLVEEETYLLLLRATGATKGAKGRDGYREEEEEDGENLVREIIHKNLFKEWTHQSDFADFARYCLSINQTPPHASRWKMHKPNGLQCIVRRIIGLCKIKADTRAILKTVENRMPCVLPFAQFKIVTHVAETVLSAMLYKPSVNRVYHNSSLLDICELLLLLRLSWLRQLICRCNQPVQYNIINTHFNHNYTSIKKYNKVNNQPWLNSLSFYRYLLQPLWRWVQPHSLLCVSYHSSLSHMYCYHKTKTE